MLTALRQQVQGVLYAIPASRKPALRRADAPEALLATDLPQVAETDAVQAFVSALETRGWTVHGRNGWLMLDVPIPAPEYVVPVTLAGECGCCISLLLRHPDTAPAPEYIRVVVKAADAGRQPFEKLCRQLHAELASRLRRHEPLPGSLLPFLCKAYEDLSETGGR